MWNIPGAVVVLLGLLVQGDAGKGGCRNPQGREGDSLTEECLKRTCKGGVWRTSLDSSVCCYEGKAYPASTVISTTWSEDHCVKASVECKEDGGKARAVLGMKNFCAEYATQEQMEEIKNLIVKTIEQKCDADTTVDIDEPTRDMLFLGDSNLVSFPSLAPVTDCPMPTFPVNNSQYTVTEIIDGHITICGGSSRDDQVYLSSCYSLREGVWEEGPPMLEARCEAAASNTDAGWLVTGGRLSISSTEYLRDGSWVPGPPLPKSLFHHCQVTVGKTVYVLGGRNRGYNQATVYILEDGVWREGPSMNSARRMPACAEYQNSIWAVGGDSNVSVERLDLETMTWHQEPDLWIYSYAANAVVHNSTLYLVHYAGAMLRLNSETHRWESAGSVGDSPDYRKVYPAPLVSRKTIGC